MILVEKLRILESNRIKRLPLSVKLDDLTVIMGPNGCGKSSILQSVADLTRPRFKRVSDTETEMVLAGNSQIPIYTLFYKEIANYKSSMEEYNDPMAMIHDVMDIGHISSGQRSFSQIEDMLDCENGLILIDEMDASLDWSSQKKFAEILHELSVKNQLIVATHSQIVCDSMKRVYDLSRRKWTTPDEIKAFHMGRGDK